ncbi:MAG: hypothetical protein IIB08_06285, partial [Bacteroidetes bacterium]|nr:hypothetical protein [Bacteroidota bacterium]
MKVLYISLLIFLLPINLFAQWEWQNPQPQGNYLHSLQIFDNNTVYATSTYTLLKTTNGGTNWTIINILPEIRVRSSFFINENVGWITAGLGLIFKTTDGGYNWSDQSPGINYFYNKIYFVNENIGWVIGGSGSI